jgi:hypothetical protein
MGQNRFVSLSPTGTCRRNRERCEKVIGPLQYGAPLPYHTFRLRIVTKLNELRLIQEHFGMRRTILHCGHLA